MKFTTTTEKQELANALGGLFELERLAGCSDKYFRQIFTAKIKAMRAGGYREMLLADSPNTINQKRIKEDENK